MESISLPSLLASLTPTALVAFLFGFVLGGFVVGAWLQFALGATRHDRPARRLTEPAGLRAAAQHETRTRLSYPRVPVRTLGNAPVISRTDRVVQSAQPVPHLNEFGEVVNAHAIQGRNP